jgi:hypothetical protein
VTTPNGPSRRLRDECDADRDDHAGVLLTQNGPRCIQAAAGIDRRKRKDERASAYVIVDGSNAVQA